MHMGGRRHFLKILLHKRSLNHPKFGHPAHSGSIWIGMKKPINWIIIIIKIWLYLLWQVFSFTSNIMLHDQGHLLPLLAFIFLQHLLTIDPRATIVNSQPLHFSNIHVAVHWHHYIQLQW